MKFISFLSIFIFILLGCHKKTVGEILEKDPSYKVMLTFSEKIKTETNLILKGYGLNDVPKDYKFINGVANFNVSYLLTKDKEDEISIEGARNLVVFVAENFLKTVNSDEKVIPNLDTYPITYNSININIHIEDKNRIHLGQGVAIVHLWDGKIRYDGYKINEYTGKFPADGNRHIMLEENYADALKKVSKKAI
jgi:hypothetical protein